MSKAALWATSTGISLRYSHISAHTRSDDSGDVPVTVHVALRTDEPRTGFHYLSVAHHADAGFADGSAFACGCLKVDGNETYLLPSVIPPPKYNSPRCFLQNCASRCALILAQHFHLVALGKNQLIEVECRFQMVYKERWTRHRPLSPVVIRAGARCADSQQNHLTRRDIYINELPDHSSKYWLTSKLLHLKRLARILNMKYGQGRIPVDIGRLDASLFVPLRIVRTACHHVPAALHDFQPWLNLKRMASGLPNPW